LGPSGRFMSITPRIRKDVMKTKQQKEDCARICAKLGITKEQYDEIDRACERAAKRFTQQSLQRLRKKEKQA